MRPTLLGLLIGGIASAAFILHYSPAAIMWRANRRGVYAHLGKARR